MTRSTWYSANSGARVERTPPSEEWLEQVEKAQWWKKAMTKSMSGSAMLRLTLFDANTVLRPGQVIDTYASVGDQPEVPGVPVGTIISVQRSSGSLTQTALVRPFVNFTTLGVVGVVVQVPKHNPRVSILPRPAPTVTVTVTPNASSSTSAGGSTSPSVSPSASSTGSG